MPYISLSHLYVIHNMRVLQPTLRLQQFAKKIGDVTVSPKDFHQGYFLIPELLHGAIQDFHRLLLIAQIYLNLDHLRRQHMIWVRDVFLLHGHMNYILNSGHFCQQLQLVRYLTHSPSDLIWSYYGLSFPFFPNLIMPFIDATLMNTESPSANSSGMRLLSTQLFYRL